MVVKVETDTLEDSLKEDDKILNRLTIGTLYGAGIGFLIAMTTAVGYYYNCPGFEEIRETYSVIEQIPYLVGATFLFAKPAGLLGVVIGGLGGAGAAYLYHKRH